MGNTVRLGQEFTGRQVRVLRKDLGLELKDVRQELARHGCVLSLSTLSRMETGKGRGPTIEELLALAVIFGVTPNRLLIGDQTESSVEVTTQVSTTHILAWYWANSDEPLLSTEQVDSLSDPDERAAYQHRRDSFRKRERPYDPPDRTPWEVVKRLEADGTLPRLFEAFEGALEAGMYSQDALDYLAFQNRIPRNNRNKP